MPDVSMSGISIRIVSDSTEASRAIATLTKQIEKLNSTLSRSNGIKSFSSNMSKLSGNSKGGFSAFKAIAAPFKSGFQDVSRFAKGLGGVFNAFKRIAMYRILRFIIKEITQAFAEGTKNLYGWSKAVGGATMYGKKFAQTMDSLATSGGYFKNSIGAMVAPIISALAPAIDFIIDKIVALINVINQLFALLGGATSWNRATRKAQEFEDAAGGAGGAAKEALRYLAPFDELNVLPDEKSGGGGGGGTDYSGMFEETSEFMEGIQDFVANIKAAIDAQDWQGLGELLGDKVNEIVDWMDEKGLFEKAGKKVGGFINAWFTTKYWTLETINFQNIGAKIAEFFNNAIGEINFEVIGASLVQKFTIIGDFIIGAITNIDWGKVAKSAGDLLKGALDQLSGWIGDVNWANLAHTIFVKVGDAVNGVDWSGIVSSIARLIGSGVGAAAAALMQLGLDIAIKIWDAIKKPFQNDENGDGKVTGQEIWNGIKAGIVSAVTGIGTWIKENIWQPFIDGIKSAFGIASPATTMVEPGEMISEGLLQGITSKIKEFPQKIADAWKLVEAWFADLPAKFKQTGINMVNSLTSTVVGGINSLIDQINSSGIAEFFGIEIKKLEFDLIPNLPEGELTKNYDEAKAAIEAESQQNPVEIKGKITAGAGGIGSWLGGDGDGGGSGIPEVSFQAKVTKLDLASNLNPPILNSTANFNDWQCYGSKTGSKVSAFTTWKSTANWNDYQVYGSKSGSSISRFTTWNSTANFTRKTIASSIPKDGENPKIDVTANITKFSGKNRIDLETAAGGVFKHGAYSSIPQYAGGTSKAHGSIFIAGEAGPEVVGHIGGRTEVLNRSQLAATMYSAVTSALASLQFNVTAPSYSASTGASEGDTENMLYRAFVRAIEDTGMDDPSIELDGDTLYKSVVRRNRQNTRATGVNQLAMA